MGQRSQVVRRRLFCLFLLLPPAPRFSLKLLFKRFATASTCFTYSTQGRHFVTALAGHTSIYSVQFSTDARKKEEKSKAAAAAIRCYISHCLQLTGCHGMRTRLGFKTLTSSKSRKTLFP